MDDGLVVIVTPVCVHCVCVSVEYPATSPGLRHDVNELPVLHHNEET